MTDFELYIMSLDRFKNRKPVFVFQLDGSGNYDNRDVCELHHAWQSSASREGYKLVPLVPTEDMMHAGMDDVEHEISDWTIVLDIYKTMVRVSN